MQKNLKLQKKKIAFFFKRNFFCGFRLNYRKKNLQFGQISKKTEKPEQFLKFHIFLDINKNFGKISLAIARIMTFHVHL